MQHFNMVKSLKLNKMITHHQEKHTETDLV